jgi:hypothetical protein
MDLRVPVDLISPVGECPLLVFLDHSVHIALFIFRNVWRHVGPFILACNFWHVIKQHKSVFMSPQATLILSR